MNLLTNTLLLSHVRSIMESMGWRKNMKQILMTACLFMFAATLITGCKGSTSRSIAGTYRKEESKRTLTLTSKNTFELSTGGTGSYKIDGNRIRMENPNFTGFSGEIRGNHLVFPNASSEDIFGQSFEGWWTRN